MNVLINAISIVEGGGLVVLRELLKEMREVDPKIIWYIAAPPSTLSHLSPSDRIVLLPNTWANKSPLHLFCWYEFSLPQLINQFNIELCFSKTNFLPRRKMKCPSLLLIHHAGFFSDEFEMLYLAWRRKRTASFIWKQKKKWMNSSIKKAEHVTVQTIVLADKIKNETKITEKKISVIPHGTGMIDFYSEKIKSHSSGSFRIGYITKFGVQKDFETAINAVRQLKAERYPVKLILTLETNSSDSLYHMMKDDDVTDVIENTQTRIKKLGIRSLADVQKLRVPVVSLSEPLKRQIAELKRFLHKNLYQHYRVVRMTDKGQRFLKSLFQVYLEKPAQLPPEVLVRSKTEGLERALCDYLAGMTDRFAQDEYKRLFEHYERI